MTISFFQCKTPTTKRINRYTPTSERCWLQSSSVHPHDEDQEVPWLQALGVQNAEASLREKLGKIVSGHISSE